MDFPTEHARARLQPIDSAEKLPWRAENLNLSVERGYSGVKGRGVQRVNRRSFCRGEGDTRDVCVFEGGGGIISMGCP